MTKVAWEILRESFERNGIKGGSFVGYLIAIANASTANKDIAVGNDNDNDNVDNQLYAKYANNRTTTSYNCIQAAAEEIVPSYKVEPAKSTRSKCMKCMKLIEEGGVCMGWHDKLIGVYRVREVSLVHHGKYTASL